MIDEGDEGGVHATSVATGEVGVGVFGIGFDLLVAHGDDRFGELIDAVMDVFGNGDVALGEDEGVVGVVGGVEEVLTVELAEDERLKDVAGGDGGLRVFFLNCFEACEGAVVVEIVEERVGLADLGGEVDGIGVGGGIVGVRAGWGRQQEREKKTEDFDAAFYGSSPKPEIWVAIEKTTVWMPAQLIVLDDADLILDAGEGKLYPLIPW